MLSLEQAEEALGGEFTFFSRVVQTQLERLGLDRSARVLDVGTGAGRMAITLALSGFQVLTGEPEEDHSEYAKQAWREAAEQVGAMERLTFQAFDAARLPFSDGAFDAVFMMGALHHMADPATAVSECTRVLAPGGVLCILEPNGKLVEIARSRMPTHPDPTDPRPFAGGMDLQVFHDEMFDVYLIHRAPRAR